ncbi:gamma-glutamyl-gamma-aminobutyrate hydrolase family protein [Collimonas sp.]|uniref:gamma-glutamyl-gamma-aminobutyrate hydrolase family protein n=1 Tax=Collimonas sp. TaxID=1963772 RepID=UPI002C880ACD|nr:gamma-glutamyl-gamma-aminobutyrate hydrolase family protein [Collimonas sp.]HWX02318.1 gamma-glutamyl-gamma-aminobutyrate hydrolase family protein [Collimonas sp.]
MQRMASSPRSNASLGAVNGAAPIQRYSITAAKKPGAYLEPKAAGSAEEQLAAKTAFRQRMRDEMAALRAGMEAKDKLAVGARAPSDNYGPAWKQEWPDYAPKAVNPEKRKQIDAALAARTELKPKVAISYREGFGYDKRAFSAGATQADAIMAPSGNREVGRGEASLSKKELEALHLARERVDDSSADPEKAAAARAQLRGDLVGANGLYIPGGQDAVDESTAGGAKEKTSRETYEQAMIKHARNTGLPLLAICGGSRSMARGFGASEAELGGADLVKHNQKGTTVMSHALSFPDPHTILGGAAPKTELATPGAWPEGSRSPGVDAVNSTHKKVIALDPGTHDITGGKRLPADNKPELIVSALSPGDNHAEGFETRHGAPMVGVTSHPEAIHGAIKAAYDNATDQGGEWSDNVFEAFEQSMQTHGRRQALNKELLSKKGDFGLEGPAVILPPSMLRDRDPDYWKQAPAFFGSARPGTRRGGHDF